MTHHNAEICDSLDAAIYSGDDFIHSKTNLEELEKYLDNWSNTIKSRLRDIEYAEECAHFDKLEQERK